MVVIFVHYCVAMDFNLGRNRHIIAIFSQIAGRLNRRFLFGLLLLLVCLPSFVSNFLFWRLEHRMEIKIHHKPYFTPFLGVIHLRNASLDFKDVLKIKSGSVVIHYPLTAVFKNDFPMSLRAKNIVLEAGPELRKTLGNEQVIFDQVSADLILQPKRKVSVQYIDATSKTIQFHFGSG